MDNFYGDNNENMNNAYDDVYVKGSSMIMPGDQISVRRYNLVIGACLLWGFIINYLIVTGISFEKVAGINPVLFIIGYVISCIAGIAIYRASDNPLISFLGYNLIVLPLGFALNITIGAYVAMGVGANLIGNAISITGVVTLTMMCLAVAFPNAFIRAGKVLGISLLITFIVELIMVLVTGNTSMILDGVIVLIFCGYIGYDWGRANAMPKTYDNAIDGAAGIYLDIINLFIRILRILARSRRD